MGHWKQRLTTTITAELKSWRLRGPGVEGTIYNSIDPEYRDGEKFILMNLTLQHYPYAQDFWPDHWVVSTQTGKHFIMVSTEQAKS